MAEVKRKGFKGSIGGFQKEDVTEFILELSKKYTEAENDYRSKIAALEAENEQISARLAMAESRAAYAEEKASEAAERIIPVDAKKAAEALSEIKKLRVQLKKAIREFESKYGDVLPVSGKGAPVVPSGPDPKESISASAPRPPVGEPRKPIEQKRPQREGTPSEARDDFESYIDELNPSTLALFRDFDKKYGSSIADGSAR